MSLTSALTSGLSVGSQILLYLLIGAVIIGIIIVVMYIRSFKDTIILKKLAKERKIISVTKWRDYIDGDGIPFLQTLKKVGGRRLHPIPPPDAVEIREDGKKFLEAYVTETGELHYIRDKGYDTEDETKHLEAFTTKQRSILISQYKKAWERKGKSWQELIIPIVGIAALVIIVVSLLIFYKDMGEPLLAMADKQLGFEQEQTKQYEIMERMNSNIQIIAKQVGADTGQPAPN